MKTKKILYAFFVRVGEATICISSGIGMFLFWLLPTRSYLLSCLAGFICFILVALYIRECNKIERKLNESRTIL